MREVVNVVFGADEITPPGIILEQDRPEWSLVKRERLVTGQVALGALAANFNKFLVQPTIGSDVIFTLTHLVTDQESYLSIGEAVVPSAAAGTFLVLRDGRRGVNARGMTRIFTKQEVALTSVSGRFLIPVRSALPIPAFITASGSTMGVILLESTVVNVTQVVYFAGYERIARKEELADL